MTRKLLPVICASVALPFAAFAEQPASDAATTRTVTTTVDRDVTQNEDGSRTVDTNVTHTNEATGRSWGRDTTATVVKTEDGRSWDSSTTATQPNGGTLETTGSGSVTRGEDGTRTVAKSVTRTNPETGESATHSVERIGTKTEDGAEWTANRSTDTSRGGHSESTTSGSATRSGDGSGSFESHTSGSGTGAAGREHGWETDRSGSWERNDSGGRDFERSRDTTTASGRTSSKDQSGSSVRNADGSRTRTTTTERRGNPPKRAGQRRR